MAVIIKGKSIKCSQSSREHYLRGPENEKVIVLHVKGFATRNADEALQMIELAAKGTRCQKPLYSAKINPEPDRVWTIQEAQRAVEMLEENLGLTDHPRVVVEHQKHGRTHYHVLWSRFHPNGGAATNMGNDYAIHQKTQRQIEKAFKLKPMNARGRDFKHWEVEWAKRYGYDPHKLRDQITKEFNSAKNGQGFIANLKTQGIVLCQGDKSQFVIILPWGQHKALSSMIYGRPPKAVLRRALADIDIKKLPTVLEGKAIVKATLPKAASRRKARAKGSSGRSFKSYAGKPSRSLSSSTSEQKAKSFFSSRRSSPVSNRPSAQTQAIASSVTNPNIPTSSTAATPTGHAVAKPLHTQIQRLPVGVSLQSSAAPSPNLPDPAILHKFKAVREETQERQPTPKHPIMHGGMSAAQRADLAAAIAGKMPWADYFRKWGRRGPTL